MHSHTGMIYDNIYIYIYIYMYVLIHIHDMQKKQVQLHSILTGAFKPQRPVALSQGPQLLRCQVGAPTGNLAPNRREKMASVTLW